MVKGEWMFHKIPAGVMFPKPVQKPHPPLLIGGYVDRVLKRAAVAGDGWLTYFYRPESFATSWAKIRDFAKDAGKNPESCCLTPHSSRFVSGNRAPPFKAK